MKKGFTLIEVIAAIFVLLVGVLGTFAATRQIISYISLSNSKLIATYLSQEGIEIIRNIRDTNWLEGESWDNGLTVCVGGCEADYNDSNLSSWTDPGTLLNFDGSFYSYDITTNPTKFKRKITIESVDTNNDGEKDLKVAVLVEWEEKGKIKETTVRENLYNYRK